jgi:dUTP diphosphatase
LTISPSSRLTRVQIRIARLDEGASLPTRAHQGDAGLDLYACEAAHIGPGERWSVGTGVAVEIPEGHAGLVLPRSGIARDHGIALVNSPGLIDSGYRGELRVLLLNTDPAETFRVTAGDRIAQLVIAPIALPTPVEAPELAESSRGDGGFGSSGR